MACLRHCQTSVIEFLCENVSGEKLLIVFAKNSVIDTAIDRILNTPLRVYFSPLFLLGIILNLEFHILAKFMLTGIKKHRAEACNFIKKETPAQVFSCKFCEISNNTFSYRTLLVAASVLWKFFLQNLRNLSKLLPKFLKRFIRFN